MNRRIPLPMLLCLLLTIAPAVAGSQTARPRATVFIVASSDGAGIRIWPGRNLTPPPNVLDALDTAARAARIDLRIAIYPEQADCILNLQLNEVHSGAEQFWTLIDTASGTQVQNGRSRSVSLAVHAATKSIGRHCIGTVPPVAANN